MNSADLTRDGLRDHIANALRGYGELEAAYETLKVDQLVSMRARTDGSTVAIDIFERGERATYSEMDSRAYGQALLVPAHAGDGDRRNMPPYKLRIDRTQGQGIS
ncbi:hypothetical protein ACM41_05670 [Bradyrhizobium sp. CCBAU 21362]|nr:hypothetical protein [Bradyrhizobium sp. CCBAU 21362]